MRASCTSPPQDLLEYWLGAYALHWQLPVGVILLLIVLFAPQGIAGLLARRRHA